MSELPDLQALLNEAYRLGLFRPLCLARIALSKKFKSIRDLGKLSDAELLRYSQVGPKIVADLRRVLKES